MSRSTCSGSGAIESAPEAVAAYIAKYATKSTDPLGRLDRRLRQADLDRLGVPQHLERLVRTAWDLGGRPELDHLRLRKWAHTLGFRGHWLTKSRRYSTTLGALRTARAEWKRARQAEVGVDVNGIAVKHWRYLGRGWDNPGDEWLARTAAAGASEARRLAREAAREPRAAKASCRGWAVDKLLVTPEEAAAILSIGRSKVYELLSDGRLGSVRIDASRRVPVQALLEFVEQLQAPAPVGAASYRRERASPEVDDEYPSTKHSPREGVRRSAAWAGRS